MAVITAQTRPPGTDPRRSRWRNRLNRLDVKVSPYLFVAPFFIVFAIFGIYPLIWTLWVSVHKTELITADKMGKNVGFTNYHYILHDSFFWNALTNTLTLGVISAVPQLLLALFLAHVLNRRLRFSTFWRVSVLAPYVTSVAAASVVFAQLFNRDVGVVNYVLHTLFHTDNIYFQQEKWPAQIAIASIVMWRWTGYNALIYLAGMQAIPKDLYEAAEVDGAGQWRQFRSVTIPSLRPTILFTIVVSTIGSLQLFGEPLLFSAGGTQAVIGGASRQYQTLAMYFYERGITLGHLGSAAAVAVAMFVITIIFVVINTVVTRRIGQSED